jgi:hypothetical protein
MVSILFEGDFDTAFIVDFRVVAASFDSSIGVPSGKRPRSAM